MKDLIYKEFRLCMQPLLLLYFLAAFMILIPNYPYLIPCFFIGNAIFNSMQMSQANSDILFTAMLPVSKNSIVKAKYLYVVCIQLLFILVTIPVMLLNHAIVHLPNNAGIDACPAMYLGYFLVFTVFNCTFLPTFYRNVSKIGRAFLVSTIAVFIAIFLFEGVFIASSAAADKVHIFAWIKNNIDCWPSSAASLGIQLGLALLGAAVYAVFTYLSYRRSCALFDKVDI